MNCRAIAAYKFRTRVGFKQYDIILTKGQSVLTNIKSSFEGGNIQRQYSVLDTGLIYIFMNINLQQKLMKIDLVTEILTMK